MTTSHLTADNASVAGEELLWQGLTTTSRTTADDVHARIRAMIYGGQLRSGDRLPAERRLSEIFAVSRSTLREALSGLRAEGYVEVRRGVEGGTFVTQLTEPYARWLARMAADETLLRDIIEVRMAVECQIVWQAATRRTDRELEAMEAGIEFDPEELTPLQFRASDARFHALLAKASRSPRLQRLMDDARGELFTPASDLLMDPKTIVRSHREHHAILAAVRDRDRDHAVDLVRDHLESTMGDVVAAIATGSLTH